jgi:ribosomal protein S18 acetylase RimI-like enzyme
LDRLVPTIRSATPEDAVVIADINVRSWRHAYRGIIPDAYLASLDREGIASRVRKVALSGTSTIVVATCPGVCGFSWMSRSRDVDMPSETAEVIALYVDPMHERRGIGRALALASCDAARSQGFTRLSLWVLEENARARAFYNAVNFVDDGTTKTTERWGGTPIREVRYVHPIGR